MGKTTLVLLLVASALITNCFAISKVEQADDGYETYVGQFAWFTHIEGYLESNKLVIVCGGTIISSTWVITEAYCGMTPSSWHLYFGNVNFEHTSESTEAIISNNFIKHPQFNNAWVQYNIALIELPRSIDFSLEINAITLPWESINEPDITTFFVGSISYENFSEIRWNFLQIITEEECSKYMDSDKSFLCTLGTESNVNQTPCGVSDGSILAYFSNSSWIQIGIGSRPSCLSDFPGKFTRVSIYLDWIASVTGISN